MNEEVRAGGVQAPGDRRAEAPRGAGDERGFTGERFSHGGAGF